MNSDPRSVPILPRTCGGCGCWCDDIAESGNTNPHWSPPCELGRQYFAGRDLPGTSARSVAFHDPTAEKALAQVADQLRAARRPLIGGLSFSSLEAQRLAVAVADRCRGLIDPWQSPNAVAKLMAYQQGGEITATWGEIKNRADVMIYWRCQPAKAPRFRERYGDLSDGQWASPTKRTVFVVDSHIEPEIWRDPPIADRVALHFVKLGDQDQVALRWLAESENEPFPAGEIGDGAAIDPSDWTAMRAAVTQARYGAVVVGDLQVKPSDVDTSEVRRAAAYQLLNRWVAAANLNRRFVCVPFPHSPAQTLGIQAALTWRTGFPMSVDLTRGYPVYDPLAVRWRRVLEQDQVDLVLWIGGDHRVAEQAGLNTQDLATLNDWARRQPLIEFGTQTQVPHAQFHFPSAGLGEAGTAGPTTIARADGVLLPLRTTTESGRPTEAQWLERLLSKLSR